MTTEQLKQMHTARPFRPFTLRLADGEVVPVPHPEFLFFSPSGRTIVVATPDDAFKIIDLLLVTSIDVGTNGKSKRKARR